MSSDQVFLLSPAQCSGQRARLLLNEQAEFFLARKLRSPEGALLGDVFSFLSGLYFRGKATYARAFARPPAGLEGIRVITTSRGLLSLDTPVRAQDILEFAAVPILAGEPRYEQPLVCDSQELATRLKATDRVVLLGSIASGKYVDLLTGVFGERLVFPTAFVGRGDMSRGGLLLRCVDEGRELEYAPVAGAIRRGSRPARLPKRP